MKASLSKILRIARRDAAAVMGRRSYIIAALGPALLTVFIGVVMVVAGILVAFIQVADIQQNPMGNGQVLVLGQGQLPQELGERVESLLKSQSELENSQRGTIGWVTRLKSYVNQIKDDVDVQGNTAPEAPITDPITWVKSFLTLEEAKLSIPGQYDAAIVFELKYEEGHAEPLLNYEILSDPAILYSRVMARRLTGIVDAYNEQFSPSSGRAEVDLTDHPKAEADPWPLYVMLLMGALSVVYLYHGVAVQSAASVLAGERDNRTLEVLLSLPISARQMVWGKLLALASSVVVPTSLWVFLLSFAAHKYLGLNHTFPQLLLLCIFVLLPLTAIACAISATAPSTLAAQNRLGFANLLALMIGAALLYLGQVIGLGSQGLLSGLILTVALGSGWYLWVSLFGVLSFVITASLVEIAARGMSPTP